MKAKKEIKTKGRRSFLSNLFKGGAAVLIAPGILKADPVPTETIKLLTPDGKLIEIDKSHIEGTVTSQRASNEEVLKWMKVNMDKS